LRRVTELGHILVVEDDELLRECLCEALIDEGYLVARAAEGRAALAEYSAHRPDLVVLDLMMPVMDGWAFRAAQRELDPAGAVPVIVLSAVPDAAGQVGPLGAAAVLQKPFDLSGFLDTVSRVISARGRNGVPGGT